MHAPRGRMFTYIDLLTMLPSKVLGINLYSEVQTYLLETFENESKEVYFASVSIHFIN